VDAQVKFGLQAGVSYSGEYYPVLPTSSSEKFYSLSPVLLVSVRSGKKKLKFINEFGYSRKAFAVIDGSLKRTGISVQNGMLFKSQLEYRFISNTGIALGVYGSVAKFEKNSLAQLFGLPRHAGYTVAVSHYFKHVFLQLAYQRSIVAGNKIELTDDNGNITKSVYSRSRQLQLSVGYLF
jgi:hypothetical protein